MEIQDIDLKQLIESQTTEKFDRKGYIKCPFHNEKTPSLSVKFFADKNKEKFRCWGCEAQGDALDFIMQYKGLDYVAAREYLELSVQKSEKEEQIEKIKKYIEWEISTFKKGEELLGLFPFVNSRNEVVYYKAKFKQQDGKKNLSYYHLDNGRVANKRGSDELVYNLYNVIEGIKDDKVIIIVEGEKDANTLNSLLKKERYVATSIKNCKDLSELESAKIYVCSDTGEAGEAYKWEVYKELFKSSKEFKFINLPDIKKLGDNKDVTDWLEAGHDKKDLLNAFNRSLDLQNKYELQQDIAIYKYITKEVEGETTFKKKYITDFKLLEATRIKYVDVDEEGVKIILKSATGQKITRQGPATVFDDVKSFRNFLGTLDLAYKSRIEDLTDLKIWINKYFALESEEIYSGTQFRIIDNETLFISSAGAMKNNKTLENIKTEDENINIEEIEDLTVAELKEIKKHIFRFATPEKSICILGTIINNLAVAQCREIKIKLHHLLLVGEAGSGKSTILENVIAPVLNYKTNQIKSLGLATNFSLIKDLSSGNYTMIYEEHKPSAWDRCKISKISEVLRNLYDNTTVSRGDKTLTKLRNFCLSRPVVIAGEESYFNDEKASIDRSCIVYMSKNERTQESTEAIRWIIENEKLLNKFGKALIKEVLNLSVENCYQIRKKVSENIEDLKDRPLNTAINIAAGIEILNLLLKRYNIKGITNYEEHIVKNIKTEVLEGGEEAHSVVEQMLTLYNDMIEDDRALHPDDVVKFRGGEVFMKTTEMLNQIREHINKTGTNATLLSLKDFRKQAKKAGYLLGTSNKVLKIGNKTIRFDTYSTEKLRELKIDSIVPPELVELEDNIIPFK